MPCQPCNSAAPPMQPGDAYAFLRAWLSAAGPSRFGPATAAIPVGFETADASFWAQLVNETDYHGVTLLVEPAFALVARTGPSAMPADTRRTFLALASRHRQIAAARERCVDRLLTAFASAGITMILLKGAALAHRIYPSPELRPMIDIDILIDPAQAKAAVKAASELGYRFAPRHSSRFAGRLHHIPAAEITESGFRIFLEIHIDAMHLDQPYRLVLSNLASKPVPFKRGCGAGRSRARPHRHVAPPRGTHLRLGVPGSPDSSL